MYIRIQIVFKIVILVLSCFIIYSCTKRVDDIAPKYRTVEQFKKIIGRNKDCHKVVFVYDPNCGQCERHFRYIVDNWNNINRLNRNLKFYLVTLSNEWKMLNPHFLQFVKQDNVFLYSIKDRDKKFILTNSERIENIIKYIVNDDNIFTYEGFPYTIIFSKDNKVLKTVCDMDGKQEIVLANLVVVGNRRLSSIDFSKLLNTTTISEF